MILMDIRVLDPKHGYRYVTLAKIKNGDRFQFDFLNDPFDLNPLGSDWFVCSKDAYIDSVTGDTVVEVEKPINPRYPFEYLSKLKLKDIEVQRRGAAGYGIQDDSGDWRPLV